MQYNDTSLQEIDNIMQNSWEAFQVYKNCSLKQRADFMRAIATQIELLGDELLQVAGKETNLPEGRLKNERARTMYQLTSYADACERGQWLDARIDKGDGTKPDLRKMLIPLGPVAVFGAANFPFAYSTAGGDTACAFAAGCPVIVKAHPEHAATSELVASAIHKAAKECNLPAGVFAHIHARSHEVAQQLITHPHLKAIGFTGSLKGGKAIFDLANGRSIPIPVFAEMSSINPIFLLEEKLQIDTKHLAEVIAGSITLGVGQFCTNPGLLIAIESSSLENFIKELVDQIKKVQPATMLNTGIYKNYSACRESSLAQPAVKIEAVADQDAKENQGIPTVASVSATVWLANPKLHEEVFGPYSLIIKCANREEQLMVAQKLEGQLTTSLMATETDLRNNNSLIEAVKEICGRLVLNGVPTGVEVCLSQHHGGPFPATTDSRFTAVGADGIKRFARPIAYQNWDNSLLPDELKNENPLGIWRTVNDDLTKERIN